MRGPGRTFLLLTAAPSFPETATFVRRAPGRSSYSLTFCAALTQPVAQTPPPAGSWGASSPAPAPGFKTCMCSPLRKTQNTTSLHGAQPSLHRLPTHNPPPRARVGYFTVQASAQVPTAAQIRCSPNTVPTGNTDELIQTQGLPKGSRIRAHPSPRPSSRQRPFLACRELRVVGTQGPVTIFSLDSPVSPREKPLAPGTWWNKAGAGAVVKRRAGQRLPGSPC